MDREVVEDHRLRRTGGSELRQRLGGACKFAHLEVALGIRRALPKNTVMRSSLQRFCGQQLTSSDVNFFCWKMDLSASEEGAQVPFCFWRQRSLSEARMETTSWRLSGLSGEATQ